MGRALIIVERLKMKKIETSREVQLWYLLGYFGALNGKCGDRIHMKCLTAFPFVRTRMILELAEAVEELAVGRNLKQNDW